jgi:hypothetical protein
MRKITKQAIAAFTNGKNFKDGNTEVEAQDTGTTFLFYVNKKLNLRNAIAAHSPVDGLSINLCGWNTNTTRDRLNGLPGVRVNTKQGQAFLNGNPIPSNGWVKISV